jgi:hypothetical protein
MPSHDNRQHPDRKNKQFFGAVGGFGIKIERITGAEVVGPAGMAVYHLPVQQVNEFHPLVLEQRKDIGLIGECYQVRLHPG